MADALCAATAMSAALAATGAWRGSRVARWQAFWPVPLMAFAIGLAARDLALMLEPRGSELPFSSLALGVWAGVVVTLAGANEIAVIRRGGPDGRRLIAAALLVASGSALLLYHAETSSRSDAIGIASGLLILLSGVLLVMLRSMARPSPALHLLWPAALLAGALAHRLPGGTDGLAEAGREMDVVLVEMRRVGARVVPAEAPAGVPRFVRGPVRTFWIDGNEVQVYLIAHDDDASPEAHLSPRAAVPPPIGGVPHLHVGPHILVLCLTADSRFARQLDRIVQDLGGHRRRGSARLIMSASR